MRVSCAWQLCGWLEIMDDGAGDGTRAHRPIRVAPVPPGSLAGNAVRQVAEKSSSCLVYMVMCAGSDEIELSIRTTRKDSRGLK